MFRLTLRNLGANKVRFALTTFGVMLAVSFVVSALVLGDGLRSTFGDVSEEITAGVDLEVRPVSEFGDPEPLPAELLATVNAVDGVADAVPVIEAVEDGVRPIPANGEPISTSSTTFLGFGWSDNEAVSPFSLAEGAAPSWNEFVIDLDSAAKHGFVIGDAYDVITPTGMHTLTLSGTSSFGAENNTVGAVLTQMNAEQAGELFGVDGLTSISVQLTDGADTVAVQTAVSQAVASIPRAEVVDHATVLQESNAEFTSQINIIGNILLGFGGVALFVSIFIIYNTFAIVLGQRTRELALLRTVGAAPNQILRSVLGEALFIGALASAAGIGGGIAVAEGLTALFNATGASLPDSPTIIATRTIVAAVGIGIGVTMIAAIGPARRASTVPAIAALRGTSDAAAPGSRTRIILGAGLFAVGALAGAIGLAGIGSTAVMTSLIATGAIGIFLGVTVLSPMAVDLVTRILGWPLTRVSGVAGRLAQQNAARNPRRTATTAAALMIGLALVSTAMVVGASVKSRIGSTLQQTATADYYVTDQLDDVEFPLEMSAAIAADDVVEVSAGFRYVETRVNGAIDRVVAVDFTQVPTLLNLDVRSGSYDTATEYPVLVSAKRAESDGLIVGDVVTTEFSNGASIAATIVGVFHDEALIVEPFLFDDSVFEAAGDQTGYEWFAISLASAASTADVDAFVAQLGEVLPQADIETAAAFVDRVEGLIDETLVIVNAMVALAVVIALIGIANTLALSVSERTRELGLLRAVGMTRSQLGRMVRYEAALVATFGAVLGVTIGVFFGWGVVQALPTSFASSVSVPVQSIAVLVVIAAIAGVVAAVLPAHRAARLDVLEAISH